MHYYKENCAHFRKKPTEKIVYEVLLLIIIKYCTAQFLFNFPSLQVGKKPFLAPIAHYKTLGKTNIKAH
jgi:hypothetical protein